MLFQTIQGNKNSFICVIYFTLTLNYQESKGCLQKKNIAQKVTLEHTGGRGVKKFPLLHQKGDIYLWREGSKSFCHMSHVHFCVFVSTQFLAFFEALHYEKFIYHVIK